jgi:hypothetical protein
MTQPDGDNDSAANGDTKVLAGLLVLMLTAGLALFGFAIFYADALSH